MHQIFSTQNAKRTVSSVSLLSISVHDFCINEIWHSNRMLAICWVKSFLFISIAGFILFLYATSVSLATSNVLGFIFDFKFYSMDSVKKRMHCSKSKSDTVKTVHPLNADIYDYLYFIHFCLATDFFWLFFIHISLKHELLNAGFPFWNPNWSQFHAQNSLSNSFYYKLCVWILIRWDFYNNNMFIYWIS